MQDRKGQVPIVLLVVMAIGLFAMTIYIFYTSSSQFLPGFKSPFIVLNVYAESEIVKQNISHMFSDSVQEVYNEFKEETRKGLAENEQLTKAKVLEKINSNPVLFSGRAELRFYSKYYAGWKGLRELVTKTEGMNLTFASLNPAENNYRFSFENNIVKQDIKNMAITFTRKKAGGLDLFIEQRFDIKNELDLNKLA